MWGPCRCMDDTVLGEFELGFSVSGKVVLPLSPTLELICPLVGEKSWCLYKHGKDLSFLLSKQEGTDLKNIFLIIMSQFFLTQIWKRFIYVYISRGQEQSWCFQQHLPIVFFSYLPIVAKNSMLFHFVTFAEFFLLCQSWLVRWQKWCPEVQRVHLYVTSHLGQEGSNAEPQKVTNLNMNAHVCTDRSSVFTLNIYTDKSRPELFTAWCTLFLCHWGLPNCSSVTYCFDAF